MRIWTGRAGSGKTTALLREIAGAADRDEGRQVLIIPELFSHAYERRLAEATGNHGARTAEVLTFSRLTGRVFAEVGGLADTVLSPAGRLLTLQEAIRRVESGLRIYAGASQKPETVRELLRAVDEFKCYGVLPEQLFEASEELAGEEEALAGKLRDLGQLYTMYDRLCAESLPDPRDALSLLAARLPESHALDGVQVYLDSFLGFTPQEIAVIDAMMAKGIALTAAVTCDFGEPDIFLSGCKTVKLLRRMARRHNLEVQTEDFGGSRLARPRDLAALEREGLLPARAPRPSDGESLRIYAAASPFEECEYAAAYIRRMVRERGARYRDFVVAMRDPEPYTAALEMAMARYDVPVFVSEKTDLLQKPPLALVTGALETVTNGWRYEDFFGCLKTGLCNLAPDEIDRLENYALTWRIRGGAWRRPFTGHPDGYGLPFDDDARRTLEELNTLRERAAAPFAVFSDALKAAGAVKDYAQALYDFLEAVGAPERMADRADAHEAAGRLQMAEEYRQLWEILVGAMEQFAWVCGDAPLDATRFAQLFRLVLSEYDVGTIPVSLDRVTCGGIERVTSEPVPHLILLGVNDGLLPKAPAPGGVLTEFDRLTLDGMGLSLASAGAERMLMEQELIYRALACPAETLLLSYHTADAAGAETRPSYLIGGIRSMLEGVPVDSSAAQDGAYRLEADRPAVELACAALSGTDSPAVRAAYEFFKADERVRRAAAQRLARGPLTRRDTVAALYGKELNLTASRVDKFYSCRFAFFMQYGLRAKPRREADFAAPEAGTFIHFVLENTLAELAAREGGAAGVSEVDAFVVMRKFVRQYVEENLGGLENKTARFRYLFRRLVKTMENILQNVLDELRVSDFAPIDYELDFSRDGDLPPVSVADDETHAQLSGKVDRVDGYIRDGRLYVRVMDYKSGKKSFSLSDIWYGLNMQLILYLFALQNEGLARYREKLSRELSEVVPAGVLYVPAREELLDADREADEVELRALREKALRRSGLVTDDIEILNAMERGLSGDGRFIPVRLLAPKKGKGDEEQSPALAAASAVADLARFGRLARYAQGKLLEMGRELSRGDVRANPYRNGQQDYCQWCEFRPACQFDETAGDRARMLKTVADTEFWERIEHPGNEEGGNADGDELDSGTARDD
ncbi:MAG: PD-(D/E)XK nuclease family protein [Intestinibacillus sp.]